MTNFILKLCERKTNQPYWQKLNLGLGNVPHMPIHLQAIQWGAPKNAFSAWTPESIASFINAIKFSIREGIQGERVWLLHSFLALIFGKYGAGLVLCVCGGKPYFPTIMWSWCWTSELTLAVTVDASWSCEFWRLSIICCNWPMTGSRASWSLCFLFLMCVSNCWMSAGERKTV